MRSFFFVFCKTDLPNRFEIFKSILKIVDFIFLSEIFTNFRVNFWPFVWVFFCGSFACVFWLILARKHWRGHYSMYASLTSFAPRQGKAGYRFPLTPMLAISKRKKETPSYPIYKKKMPSSIKSSSSCFCYPLSFLGMFKTHFIKFLVSIGNIKFHA